MFRALLYGSHRASRDLVWLLGMVLFVALTAESFTGYLLPWGNMSYWGAQVIISLFGAIPLVGLNWLGQHADVALEGRDPLVLQLVVTKDSHD